MDMVHIFLCCVTNFTIDCMVPARQPMAGALLLMCMHSNHMAVKNVPLQRALARQQRHRSTCCGRANHGALRTDSQSIAEESKRLAMTNLLASALRTILATTPADVLPVLYLCTNRIAPAHEGIELGIGDAILMKVRDAMDHVAKFRFLMHGADMFHSACCSAADGCT